MPLFCERGRLYRVVNHWRELAGIEFRTKQRQGLHSLRHTLATRLLRAETPFHVISAVLGHASPATTFIHAKADVETRASRPSTPRSCIMTNKVAPVGGHSPLAPLMEQFVLEKRACGYRYAEEVSVLRRFDAFLCQQGLQRCELPKSLSWQWLATQPHENANTQLSRISVVRQFASSPCSWAGWGILPMFQTGPSVPGPGRTSHRAS